ncbi:MAG: penicillin-binding protein 2 [Candidatus Magasanikbacteria bacterium]|nr:penicillin-binding protein 2 [Candidatus Magasanikbacteria bacterium]
MRRKKSRLQFLRNRARAFAFFVEDGRIIFFISCVVLFGAAILGRLFVLQVARHSEYVELQARRDAGLPIPIAPRGRILARDIKSPDVVYPVAVDQDVFTVFIDSYLLREEPGGRVNKALVKDPKRVAEIAAKKLEIDEKNVYQKLTVPVRAYQVLKRQVPLAAVEELKLENLQGINFEREQFRFYPEGALFGQVVGFYGFDADQKPTGKYGVEGYLNHLLSGSNVASISSTEKTPFALPSAALKGFDVALTIDRTIQFAACGAIQKHMEEYKAKSATAVIMEVKTGAILALCNTPNFDPNKYKEVTDIGVFNNNAIFTPYEPGSVFKIITMAAALDTGKVTPETTFTDNGILRYGKFTIRNAAEKKYGVQTMTGVLKESINTGAVFAAEKVGQEAFKKYVDNFGFGAQTGIEMDTEVSGNISALNKKSDLNLATASFGQGFTATPLQLLSAYAAVANQGTLMKPHVVDYIIKPDGTVEKKQPEVVRQVISSRAAKLLTAMMVVVVKDGHGKKAQVPGYYVAGKTGTAQISDATGGYGAKTNQTFIGFAPADNPVFAMLVKYEEPERRFAEYTAVPVFGEIAKFLVNYLQIPPSFKVDKK